MSQTTERKAKLEGRLAELKDVEPLERLVQYAFRGGKSNKSWTGEEHLVKGPRITIDGLKAILNGSIKLFCWQNLLMVPSANWLVVSTCKKRGSTGTSECWLLIPIRKVVAPESF